MSKTFSTSLRGTGSGSSLGTTTSSSPPARTRGIALPLAGAGLSEGSSVPAEPVVAVVPPQAEEPVAATAAHKTGYGKPPLHSRFKKGQSGNPKGRAKGSKNIWTILQEEAQAVVAYIENGKPTKATKQRLAIKSAMNKAVKGDLKALHLITRLMEAHAPPQTDAVSNGQQSASDRELSDREILRMMGLSNDIAPSDTDDQSSSSTKRPTRH